jgi:hypothetical protein
VIHGHAEALEFLEQRLYFRKFRIIALENAFELGEYDRCIALAFEGIEQHSQDAPGWVPEWYDWLIKVAIADDDIDQAIQYTRVQLLEHGLDKQDYFNLLKELVPFDRWKAEVESLIEEMSRRPKQWGSDFLPELLVQEERWESLIKLLQDEAGSLGVSLTQLDLYARHLVKRFPEEFADLYEKGIRNYAHWTNSRKQYQQICRQLRQMKKWGYLEQVGEIVKSLKAKYPKRIALVDELGRV